MSDPEWPERLGNPDLSGRVAVVTGGSRGIGAATARAMAAHGAAVAVVGRDEASLASVRDEILARQGRALAVRADCTREDEVTAAARSVTEHLGPADVLAAFTGAPACRCPPPGRPRGAAGRARTLVPAEADRPARRRRGRQPVSGLGCLGLDHRRDPGHRRGQGHGVGGARTQAAPTTAANSSAAS